MQPSPAPVVLLARATEPHRWDNAQIAGTPKDFDFAVGARLSGLAKQGGKGLGGLGAMKRMSQERSFVIGRILALWMW